MPAAESRLIRKRGPQQPGRPGLCRLRFRRAKKYSVRRISTAAIPRRDFQYRKPSERRRAYKYRRAERNRRQRRRTLSRPRSDWARHSVAQRRTDFQYSESFAANSVRAQVSLLEAGSDRIAIPDLIRNGEALVRSPMRRLSILIATGCLVAAAVLSMSQQSQAPAETPTAPAAKVPNLPHIHPNT